MANAASRDAPATHSHRLIRNARCSPGRSSNRSLLESNTTRTVYFSMRTMESVTLRLNEICPSCFQQFHSSSLTISRNK